jgi:protein-tyrosine phosphatase
MKKILMVCLGNICRSPLAQGILETKVDANEVFVDSAGTGAYHIGKLPDSRSISVAKKHGIDITNQRARQFQVEDFDEFDVIFVMDQSNYQNIIRLARTVEDEGKVKMILNEISPEDNSVPDPYYGGDRGFDNVFKMLDEACSIVASKL